MARVGAIRMVLIVMAAVAALILVWYVPERGPGIEEVRSGPGTLEPPLPRHFAPWPGFVGTWKVESTAPAQGPVHTPFHPGFNRRPCAVLGAPACYVRLAWEDFTRWSLTASADPIFDVSDPRQLTTGNLHYAVDGGVVVGVLASDRLPPLHVCHGLLRAYWDGEAVRVESQPAAGMPESTMALAGSEVSATCLGPSGIPGGFTRPDDRWRQLTLELRSPTDQEIGLRLVSADADLARRPSCAGGPAVAYSASPAGRWLLEVASVGAGFEAAPAGSGIVLALPPGSGFETAFAWSTDDDARLLPSGTRQRELHPGLVATEVLHPIPVLSVAAGNARIWLTTSAAGVSRTKTAHEGDLFVLGQVARRLAGAAAAHPFAGPAPGGSWILSLQPSPVVEPDPAISLTRVDAHVPDPLIWEPLGRQTHGLPAWYAPDQEAVLVLAGGSSFELRSPEAGATPTGLISRASAVLGQAARCPEVGMLPEPSPAG